MFDTNTKISDLWPQVARITIKAVQEYRSAFGMFHDNQTATYTPERPAEFLVKCVNNDCTAEYFDLFLVVAGMPHKRETYKTGTLECRGNEARDHNNSCPCKLEYEVTIEYNQEE